MRTITAIYIIILLFTLSVIIRIPNIDRPLSVRYEWVTAHTLVTLNIWNTEGITTHKFNPIYTFTNPNDHYIKCPISGVSDQLGNYYYVSYPPFAFIFPFLVFKLAGLPATPVTLQFFNITLHFLSSLLIFLIIKNIYNAKSGSVVALVGSSIYIFASTNLWYHTNVYFADILVQLFFLSTIFFYQNYLIKKQKKIRHLVYLSSSVFLMIYTEWLGVLVASVMIIHSAFFIKKRKLSLLIALSAIGALLLFTLQFSTIAGFEEWISVLSDRYSERSGNEGPISLLDLASHAKLIQMYLRNFFPFTIVLVFGFFLTTFLNRQLGFLQLSKNETTALTLVTIPVLLHHYILFQFTIIHELSLVKATVPISMLISFLTFRVLQLTHKKTLTLQRYTYFFILTLMLGLSVFFYFSHIFKPQEYLSLRLGSQIKQTSNSKETIFFKTTKTLGGFLIKAPGNFVIAPQIQYYAGRCIQVVADEEEAIKHLEDYDKELGVIYTIDNPLFKIESVNRIYNPDFGQSP